MNPQDRPSAQLHVLYELDGIIAGRDLLDAAALSAEPFVEEHRIPLSNVALESMLVHARNIIEFLIGRPPFDGHTERRQKEHTDILPTDFAPGWRLPSGRHRLDKWLDLIDKHLSHLTTSRLNVGAEGPEWHDALLSETAKVLEGFVLEVRATDSSFAEELAQRLDRFRRTQHPTLAPRVSTSGQLTWRTN